MRRESVIAGVRAGLPLAAAVALVALSFGVIAEPVVGAPATIVMSILVFAGSAQFGSVAVLAAGGGVGTALTTAILLNARYVPMGVALAPSLRGRWLRRAAYGEAMIDASWAMAHRGGGRFDPDFMVGATLPSYPAWVIGTALGVLAGDLIDDPTDLGLDVLFPAFFLFLLVGGELRRGPTAILVAALGAAIALALVPIAPAGVPVIAAAGASLVGLSRRARVSEPPAEGPTAHPEIEGDPVG
jgi:predicted branched-subunit amino acid permease